MQLIHRHRRLILLIGLIFVMSLTLINLLFPFTAHASAECAGVDTNIISCDSKKNGVWSLLLLVMKILAAGVVVVAVGGIIYGAMLYASAEDKADKVEKAKATIRNVVIGLIMFALMFSLLQFLIPGGVFNRDYDIPDAGAGPSADADTGAGSGSGDGGGSGGSGGSGHSSGSVTVADIKLRNLRDASTTSGGSVLKKGVLYRSSQLSELNEKNSEKLGELLGKNATIIDLRVASSRATDPDAKVPGAANVWVPIEGVHDQGPMVTDPTRRAQLKKALIAASHADGAVLIHCIAGKDRTGWAVAMIMYINGASDAQVMTEYMKSTDAGYELERSWLLHGLSLARSQYGSVMNYLKDGVGLSADDIKSIKNKFGA